MIHRPSRLDDATGVERGRDRRWPNAVPGPTGDRAEVTTPGRDETPPARPRYLGTSGEPRVDEVPHPIGAGPPHPLRGWRLGWSCRGRTLAHHPMAHARDRPQEDVPQLTCQWRPGLVVQPPLPCVTRWQARRVLASQGTQASRLRWSTRAGQPAPTAPGPTWPRHARTRDPAARRDAPARKGRRQAAGGTRPTRPDQAAAPRHERTGYECLDGCRRALPPLRPVG